MLDKGVLVLLEVYMMPEDVMMQKVFDLGESFHVFFKLAYEC